ncbi:MAG: M23 family metallopeptidase [Rhodospirillum sp.]|nr:M23 family metallopeptidase [Rhodospirillum sp.]MCF8490903.1 M23 family metallopeptidase [Rhodospirillum sp.]MCF8499094.1 M23 family metallopeptidase [Rhodospirillum sp.]
MEVLLPPLGKAVEAEKEDPTPEKGRETAVIQKDEIVQDVDAQSASVPAKTEDIVALSEAPPNTDGAPNAFSPPFENGGAFGSKGIFDLVELTPSEPERWASLITPGDLEWPTTTHLNEEQELPSSTVEDLPEDNDPALIEDGELADDGADGMDDTIELTITVSSGDTLMKLLGEQGIPRAESYAAVEAMRKVFDPRDIRPGHELNLDLRPHETPLGEDEAEGTTTSIDLIGLRFEPEVGTVITLNQDEEGSFHSEAQEATLVRQVLRYDGTIQSSLFEAGLEVGASQSALAELIRIYSFDVDFQRDIRKDDRFQMFYEQYYTEDGRLARTGDILYASMTLSGTKYTLYRFEDNDGLVDYYNAKGEGVRKALLRTPINGARLSSGFGKRFHPVLGYSKMHKGVDFAAPRGTPIYAAGDGVIEKAGPFSTFGNYVRIRHNSEFKTAYAHMNGFAKSIKTGARVKQGQIIGYVGTTGRSTGPHLHYEVLKQDNQVNPLDVRFPSGKTLKGTELAAFKAERQRIDVAFQSTPTVTTVARAD